jgi:hypothetical protein
VDDFGKKIMVFTKINEIASRLKGPMEANRP